MRIATWNVNSLKARMEALEKWLVRAEPDVLLIQETKVADSEAPVMPLRMLGYDLIHHGEGRWNGVGILTKVGADDVLTNFGDGPVRDSSAGAAVAVSEDDFDPFDEARMLSAVCGGVRVVCLYAPNGRVVDSPFYEGKLRWFDRLSRWLAETRDAAEPLLLAGDYNVTPAPEDVWSEVKAHGGTHVSPKERAALARLRDWGLVDTYRAVRPEPGRFSWWDYRAGNFHRNEGMRIDLLYATTARRGAGRVGGDRPRGTQGAADAVRPRAGGHRPRRAGQAVRPRLGGGAPADRGEDAASTVGRPP